MPVQIAKLPDGRTISCVNAYEVDFSVHEIFSDDLPARGIALPVDGVYLDVGANIGLFSLYLRDRCPTARIIGFEPMPEAFEALKCNMESMSPPGEPVKLAMGEKAGWAEFDYFPGVAALSTANREVGRKMSDGLRQLLKGGTADAGVNDVLQKTGAADIGVDGGFLEDLLRPQTVRAEIATLSEQIERLGIEVVDLLKIDTEGAEREVLAGIEETDWPKIRQLLVEVHLGDETAKVMAAELNRRGFATSIGQHPLSQKGAEVFHIYAAR
jgi:FkbM family methyltransferase